MPISSYTVQIRTFSRHHIRHIRYLRKCGENSKKRRGEKNVMDLFTWGAAIRFISRSRVCSGPSLGRLFLRASRRKAVHCCTMFCSMNTSTIWAVSASGSSSWDRILGHQFNKKTSVFSFVRSPFYWKILKKTTTLFPGFENPYK